MTQRQPIRELHRGMTAAAPFVTPEGFVREARNVRFEPRVGAVRRHGTDYVRNLTELDSDEDAKFASLGPVLITCQPTGVASALELKVFDEDGTQGTIYLQAELAFDTGSAEFEIGETITGDTSGATGVVVAIKTDLTAGTWDDYPAGTDTAWDNGDAEGTLTIRHTSPGTSFQAEAITGDAGGAANATGAETSIDYAYLPAAVANVRMAAIEDSVFVLNTAKTITTSAAPAGTVKATRPDYEALLKTKNWEAAGVGDIFKTEAAWGDFRAGYYQCYQVADGDDPPKFKRIPKPAQDGAVYTATTMPHRLLRVSDSPLVMEWGRPAWEPRLSGGDIEGYGETGEPIIRNKAYLEDRTILAMAFYAGRLALGLDSKEIVLSVSNDFFNLWSSDVVQTVPSDRIHDEIVVPNSGEVLWLAHVAEVMLIQCEHVVLQFSPKGEILSAGGSETGPYNGRIEEVARIEGHATVAPRAMGSFALVMDAAKRLEVFMYFGSQGNYALQQTPAAVTDAIYEDLVDYTPTAIDVHGRTIYIMTAEGRLWHAQVRGTERDLTVSAAWGWMDLDEAIAHVWGYEDRLRIVTEFESDYALLTFPDQEIADEDGFAYRPRLDRRQSLTSLDRTDEGYTTFSTSTEADPDATILILKHTISRLRYTGGGASAPTEGTTTVTGDTSGATATIIVDTVAAGSWAGSDAAGYFNLAITGTARFVSGETLTLSNGSSATASKAEQRLGSKGQVIRAGLAAVAFDAGQTEISAGDTITGQTTGATGTVEFVSLDSGTWAGGNAAGYIWYTPTNAIGFDDNEYINSGNAAQCASDSKLAAFKGDWRGIAHYVGRTFTSYIMLPTIWAGISGVDITIVNVSVFHDRTSDYEIRYREEMSDEDYIIRYNAIEIGRYQHGDYPLDTGRYESLQGYEGADTNILIQSSSPGQFRIVGLELEYEASDF